jgi:hypothetical protein
MRRVLENVRQPWILLSWSRSWVTGQAAYFKDRMRFRPRPIAGDLSPVTASDQHRSATHRVTVTVDHLPSQSSLGPVDAVVAVAPVSGSGRSSGVVQGSPRDPEARLYRRQHRLKRDGGIAALE